MKRSVLSLQKTTFTCSCTEAPGTSSLNYSSPQKVQSLRKSSVEVMPAPNQSFVDPCFQWFTDSAAQPPSLLTLNYPLTPNLRLSKKKMMHLEDKVLPTILSFSPTFPTQIFQTQWCCSPLKAISHLKHHNQAVITWKWFSKLNPVLLEAKI